MSFLSRFFKRPGRREFSPPELFVTAEPEGDSVDGKRRRNSFLVTVRIEDREASARVRRLGEDRGFQIEALGPIPRLVELPPAEVQGTGSKFAVRRLKIETRYHATAWAAAHLANELRKRRR